MGIYDTLYGNPAKRRARAVNYAYNCLRNEWLKRVQVTEYEFSVLHDWCKEHPKEARKAAHHYCDCIPELLEKSDPQLIHARVILAGLYGKVRKEDTWYLHHPPKYVYVGSRERMKKMESEYTGFLYWICDAMEKRGTLRRGEKIYSKFGVWNSYTEITYYWPVMSRWDCIDRGWIPAYS